MKPFLRLYAVIHALMALLFAGAGIALLVVAAHNGWMAVMGNVDTAAGEAIIEAMGLLAAAVVALQISQTIAEEEVIRDAHISAPTRVRRFLSRFLVVIVVAIAVEALVATFKAREKPELMLHAAAVFCAVGVMLAGWGVFIHLNRSAEELEPEAMEDAKREDQKLE
jgi:hypothetical protein